MKQHQKLPVGTDVLTIETDKISDWSPEALASRKFGVPGVIVKSVKSGEGYHQGYHRGEEVFFAASDCYIIRHEDGTEGPYDPWEVVPYEIKKN